MNGKNVPTAGRARGRPGLTGPLITQSARRQLLGSLEGHIAGIHLELAGEIKRLAHLQRQVDDARDAIRQLIGDSE